MFPASNLSTLCPHLSLRWQLRKNGTAAKQNDRLPMSNPVKGLNLETAERADHRHRVRVAHEIGLPVCEMWSEMEAGLDALAQGQPAAALEHTGRAVALVPQASEGLSMSTPAEYASFLIRLWRERSPAPPESAADWRSEVEHIQTGRRWTFNTLDELLGFLRRQAEGPDVLRPPAGG